MKLNEILENDYSLRVDEQFAADDLDRSLWLPYHLPHWSARSRAAARYDISGGRLTLRVEPDQPPWCPEFDGATRVSAMQTGVLSGPAGSTLGQHRFSQDAVVREPQAREILHAPTYGAFTLTARARLDENSMAALWMIGIEDKPEHSGVIDVMEVFGSDAQLGATRVGMGVKAFADPRLTDDHQQISLNLDLADFHEYGVVWGENSVRFFVDGTRCAMSGNHHAIRCSSS